VKPEEKTKEQLVAELMQLRQEIGEITDRLNNILTTIWGNISLAKIYGEKGKDIEKILEKLAMWIFIK